MSPFLSISPSLAISLAISLFLCSVCVLYVCCICLGKWGSEGKAKEAKSRIRVTQCADACMHARTRVRIHAHPRNYGSSAHANPLVRTRALASSARTLSSGTEG